MDGWEWEKLYEALSASSVSIFLLTDVTPCAKVVDKPLSEWRFILVVGVSV